MGSGAMPCPTTLCSPASQWFGCVETSEPAPFIGEGAYVRNVLRTQKSACERMTTVLSIHRDWVLGNSVRRMHKRSEKKVGLGDV